MVIDCYFARSERQAIQIRSNTLSRGAVLVEDHDVFRFGLKGLLREHAAIDRFWEARTLEDGLSSAREHAPSLVSLDLQLPDGRGEQSVALMRAAAPEARIIIFSAVEDTTTILACLAAGAHGYVPKRLAASEAGEAVRHVLDGWIYVPASLHHQQSDGAPPADLLRELASLSPRLQDVAHQLSTGATTKMIAFRLGLSEGTVKLHLSAIYRALGCQNRAGAVAILNRLRSALPWRDPADPADR